MSWNDRCSEPCLPELLTKEIGRVGSRKEPAQATHVRGLDRDVAFALLQ